MDNKVLDEAVEVAVRTFRSDMSIDEKGCVGPHTKMRAAILASLPVLLGEPVACDVLAPDGSLVAGKVSIDYADDILRRYEWDNCHKSNFLYAPSLGEGDGR